MSDSQQTTLTPAAAAWQALVSSDPLAAAVDAVITSWNAAVALPGGAQILFKVFGVDLTNGSNPTYAVSTTLSGAARPVTDSELTALPAIVARAKG